MRGSVLLEFLGLVSLFVVMAMRSIRCSVFFFVRSQRILEDNAQNFTLIMFASIAQGFQKMCVIKSSPTQLSHLPSTLS